MGKNVAARSAGVSKYEDSGELSGAAALAVCIDYSDRRRGAEISTFRRLNFV